ncbi:TonB-dependent receptor domain-containing protein [Parablastomonas sp. CN1-191]|uniref:TonB-dependent receptor domain-containing protein n=1 Tax=Parablastomonas sp. CN1-191 TaxID=3400908 RepID=UPI003BF8F34B
MKFFSKSELNRATCLQTAALIAVLALPNAAFAQTQPTGTPNPMTTSDGATANCEDLNNNDICDSEEVAAAGGSIVVTGSRIARPTLASPVPLTSVSTDELTNQGDVSLGDALNDLPSLRSTFSQGNSTRFIGTAGLNVLDLRGLGVSRTLVLVNGKRHITASPGDYLVDVNTIPVDLLERVDVVTGGNSAVYGSDAVAGVVNFVLKRNFDGISLKGQGGISERGDRGSYFVSGTFGKNFADGRGNVAVSAEYTQSEPLYFGDRDYLTGAYSGRCQFQTIEPTAGEPNGTDGITDTAFVCGVKNASISDAGTFGAIDASSNPTRRYLRFDNNGNVVIDKPTVAYSPFGSANQQGGFGSTLRNTGQMAPGLKRYAVNLLAHFDLSEAFRPYVEAKYVRVTAVQEGQPSFFQGSLKNFFATTDDQFNAISELRCNNPFLQAGALATLKTYGLCANTATSTFNLSRFNIDLGGRGEKHLRETYRIVAGVEGTFNDDWHYELSANYGKLKTHMDSTNNLLLFDQTGNLDGFLLATNAVLAPTNFSGSNFATNATGQKVICAVNQTSNVRPDCVPLNIFGYGVADPRAVAFSNTTGYRDEKASELDLLASVSGDLSQVFELPGGPVAFALGAEYREETASSVYDPLTASGGTFLNAIQPFLPPKLTVKEAFGEVSIPLLKDSPLGKELTIGAAARVSDYNTDTGTVWAWNVQGIYAPISDLRFRAAYATSVRAPTQSDLYSTPSQNFAQLSDPCDSLNITVGPNRAANCAAAGVPTTSNAALVAACDGTGFVTAVGQPFVNCLARTASTGYASGGNPTLVEERGRSLTLGAIFEPRFFPGFNFTVDYYRITVKNLISALGAQTILNLCYDNAGGINNPFCATVNRNPTTGLFVEPAVISGGINFAEQKTEGIDFDMSYRHTFDNGQKLSLRGIATYLLKLDNYVDPTNPLIPNRQKSELGDPEWAANFTANYDFGALDLTYSARFIGEQTIGSYETQNSYTGLCPSSGSTGYTGGTCTPGQLATLDPINNDAFPFVNYPSVIYHSVRLNYELADKKYNFYIGVENLLDKQPPYGLLGTAGGDPYDSIGRFFYAGFKANF